MCHHRQLHFTPPCLSRHLKKKSVAVHFCLRQSDDRPITSGHLEFGICSGEAAANTCCSLFDAFANKTLDIIEAH
ncbi:hypothetical protein RchiOBHm_Chr7g0216921 [Rosa chinensis]|uniref:Uncharacterized protein n=1 Tax=Rosa chinensis TaxID=74649 RepID=A0A2P6PBX4_ROSCH|nr:hypothetical protein RchiOBHm_Chr7g0216921 [Rosa chinensis]